MSILYANFQPSSTKLLRNGSNNKLLVENPILALALSKLFPYLLLMDNLLEIITWTNEDPYLNVIIIIGYSIIVMYWNHISLIALPLLMTLGFTYTIWLINSIIYDTKFNEKPTIDEILQTLHNLTVRSEIMLRPINKPNLKFRNFVQIFIVAFMLTPINILISKYLLSPQKFLWIFGVFLLTYHSPWSFLIRRLLWRSKYIRIGVFYLTGLNFKMSVTNDASVKSQISVDDENGSVNEVVNTLNGFKVLSKRVETPTKLNQIIQFEILENERRWIGLGWSKYLLPTERSNYCYAESLIEVKDLHSFQPPLIENDLYNYQWEWLDNTWSIDKEFSKKNNGWKFYDNNWENEDFADGFAKFTRSRKWIRRSRLIIDKKMNVYDE